VSQLLTAEDVVIDDLAMSRVMRRIHKGAERQVLWDGSIRTAVHSYGKNAIDMDKLTTSAEHVTSAEIAEHNARFVISSYKHGDAFIKKLPSLLADPNWDMKFKSAGLISEWDDGNLNQLVRIQQDAFVRELQGVLEPVTVRSWSPADRFTFLPTDPRLSKDFSGNPSNGIVQRALWAIRRNQLVSDIIRATGTVDVYDGTIADGSTAETYAINNNLLGYRSIPKIKMTMSEVLSLRPQRYEYENMRSILLRDQERYQASRAQRERHLAGEKFASYWDSLKQNIQPQDPGIAHLEFATIPMLPPQTASSRTWGIEIETVRADSTSRPAGWTATTDGSLPGGDNSYCDCSCDECYNSDHCNDRDESCHDDDSSSLEFVSPILNSFNSSGLRQLCNDLGTDPDENSAPGIHVHVGASDLSVADITNVMLSYSAIERLLLPLLHRKTFNYCKATSADTLRWWLAKVRDYRKMNPDSHMEPSRLAYDAPNDRYLDVNLLALSKHGTIEFRAMGAWYDYDHLSRWAWLVRELVNVSKLGIDQREWTRCRSIADVVAILRKYGSEIPDNTLIDEAISSKDFDLHNERSQEVRG
jgi:hypothetical protein